MTKKIKIILFAVLGAIVVACAAHTCVSYFNILNDEFTSLPASAAFLIIIPYALAAVVAVVCSIILISVYKNK